MSAIIWCIFLPLSIIYLCVIELPKEKKIKRDPLPDPVKDPKKDIPEVDIIYRLRREIAVKRSYAEYLDSKSIDIADKEKYYKACSRVARLYSEIEGLEGRIRKLQRKIDRD